MLYIQLAGEKHDGNEENMSVTELTKSVHRKIVKQLYRVDTNYKPTHPGIGRATCKNIIILTFRCTGNNYPGLLIRNYPVTSLNFREIKLSAKDFLPYKNLF